MISLPVTICVRQGSSGKCIYATIPFIRGKIPIIIVFRALYNLIVKEIVQYICWDGNGTEMMELLRPSLEEAGVIQNQEVLFMMSFAKDVIL